MRALVIYYSRTGATRMAAEALAAMLAADTAEIRCDRYRPGGLGYLRAALDSLRGVRPVIEVPAAARAAADLVVLATPIWTGNPATPMRAFLVEMKPLPGRVALMATHLGSPPERAFGMMESELAGPAVAKLALRERDIRDGRVGAALRGLAERLVGPAGLEPATKRL